MELLETAAEEAAAAAKAATPETKEAAEEAARQCAEQAKTRRAQVPEDQRSYGFVTCGAACGEDGFYADFLHVKQVELCGSSDASGSGTIATTVAAFVLRSAIFK